MDKQAIIDASRKRREGERIFYTSCPANGCWDSACILKCHVKDNKLIAVEPDDSVNANDSREDCGWENIWKGNVQMRRARWVTRGRRRLRPKRASSTR